MIFNHTVFRKNFVRRIDWRKNVSEILFLLFCKKWFFANPTNLYVTLILPLYYQMPTPIRNSNSISAYLEPSLFVLIFERANFGAFAQKYPFARKN